MNKISFTLIYIMSILLISCTGSNQKTYYNNPEEELCAMMEEQGWEQISNSTNVYRKDLDKITTDGKRTYKTTYWYTAAVYCKKSGDKTKYIIARPVYSSEDNVQRLNDGKLKYKSFSIIDCQYTDKYGTTYNGYISDGGSTAYLNY
ncbi:MAG: hypothetical protein IKT29_07080 [Flavobacteriales bacterium]|nr:hypothetical protein [Flavobacteriales bacterium]